MKDGTKLRFVGLEKNGQFCCTYSGIANCMTNTHLVETFKALQPQGLQKVSLFLASPYFNRGANAEALQRLYQFVLRAAPEFEETSLLKEDAYAFVFTGQGFVQGKLEKLMVELNKLLREFVLVGRYLSPGREDKRQIEWATWLRENGMLERGGQIVQKLKNSSALDKIESLAAYHTRLMIAEEVHEWKLLHNRVKGDLGIPEVILQLDLYYHNLRTELENRYFLQQKGAQLDDIEIFGVGREYYLNKSALLQIATSIQAILKDSRPSVDAFYNLTEFIKSEEKQLPLQTYAECYAYIRSACTLLINGGQIEFVAVLHQIHKDNLAQKIFFIDGKISPHLYQNMVLTAIRAKDHDWALWFTEEYKDTILGGDEELFFYRFNLAHCLFAKGNFEDALSQIPEISANSHYYRLLRRLEVKIYYELRSELLPYKLDAFRKFVERTAPKTIAANLRVMDLNFFNILNQLCYLPKKSKDRSARLLARIAQKQLLSDRAWLMEKVRELT